MLFLAYYIHYSYTRTAGLLRLRGKWQECMWQQWINGILGLWIILMPFLNLSTDGTFTWTMIITGIAVAALAFWGAAAHQDRHEHRQARDYR